MNRKKRKREKKGRICLIRQKARLYELLTCTCQGPVAGERNESYFTMCIWEIRTDNPGLAVKILNGTPREREKG